MPHVQLEFIIIQTTVSRVSEEEVAGYSATTFKRVRTSYVPHRLSNIIDFHSSSIVK